MANKGELDTVLADTIWAAGFLDGEGCFSIQQRKDARRKFNYYTFVSAAQVRGGALEVLVNLFGGNIGVSKTQGPEKKVYGTHFTWAIHGDKARKACKALRPYLRLKGRQAELIEEINGLMGPKRSKKSDETYRKLNALAEELHGMNARRKPLGDAERLSEEGGSDLLPRAIVRPEENENLQSGGEIPHRLSDSVH